MASRGLATPIIIHNHGYHSGWDTHYELDDGLDETVDV